MITRVIVLFLSFLLLNSDAEAARWLDELKRLDDLSHSRAVRKPPRTTTRVPLGGMRVPLGGKSDSLGKALGAHPKATRIFASPDQYPPKHYAAYAVVAFPSSASAETEKRFDFSCRAFLRALPPPSEETPLQKQLVTVWPVKSNTLSANLTRIASADLNESEAKILCEVAASNYNLTLGQQAIRSAKAKGISVQGRGPFLIAWTPTADILGEDTIILFMNLSDTSDFVGAKDHFQVWVDEIESDPEVWTTGFKLERLRLKFRTIINDYGQRFENVFFAGES